MLIELLSILIFVSPFILYSVYFYLKWEEKKEFENISGVVVAQYGIPENLTPLEASIIVNKEIDIKNLVAEIIFLASHDYLKLQKIENENDYLIEKTEKSTDGMKDFDKKILSALFSDDYQSEVDKNMELVKGSLGNWSLLFHPPHIDVQKIDAIKLRQRSGSVRISDISGYYDMFLPEILALLWKSFAEEKYYLKFPNTITPKYLGSALLVALLAYFVVKNSDLSLLINTLVSLAGIISFVLIMKIDFMSSILTERGIKLKNYLLGFKEYLRVAEKERLVFENAPEKRPDRLEKNLPYAIALGVENIWTKELEGIFSPAKRHR